MNFIRQILEGKADASIHHKFVRYGRGDYEKLFFELVKSKKLKVKSSYDFANDFVEIIANHSGEDMEVKGKIIVNRDFENELLDLGIEADKFSKRGKLYTAEIDTTMSPGQLKQVYEMFKENFLLLNINSENYKLKTGNTLPKPGKEPKRDFCKATLPLALKEEFAWDVKDFTKLEIKHLIKIDDIIIPPELRDDPVKARIEAKRKGKFIRILNIDGREERHEVDLEI